MPRYSIDVLETRVYETKYWVESDDPKDALRMARKGETDKEDKAVLKEIVNREPVGDPVPVGLIGDHKLRPKAPPGKPKDPDAKPKEGLFGDYGK